MAETEVVEQQETRVGEPMRPDDLQNQFRAPDVKVHSLWGEDMVQFGPGPTAEQLAAPPPETHPQAPGGVAQREEEEEA